MPTSLLDDVRAAVRRLRRRARQLLRPGTLARDLDEELRLHLESAAAEYRAQGMSPGAAWRQAHVDFGDLERVRRSAERARGGTWIEDFRRDVRVAVRSAGRERVFAVTAVGTLALAIATGTVGGLLVDLTRRPPLPVPAGERLVELTLQLPAGDADATALARRARWSVPQADALREALAGPAARAIGPLALSYATDMNVAGDPSAVTSAPAERVIGELVGAGYLPALGVSPSRGRAILAAEDDHDAPGDAPVALVSHALAVRRFGSAGEAVGRRLRVNGVPVTVIGILPSGFAGLEGVTAIWLPLAMGPVVDFAGLLTSADGFVRILAPVASTAGAPSDASLRRARATLATLAPRIAAAVPEAESALEAARRGAALAIDARPLREVLVDPGRTRDARLVAGALVALLGIAGVNLVALHLARGVARRREMALRVALGAAHARVLRQSAAEGAALTAAGILAGAGGAIASIHAMLRFQGSPPGSEPGAPALVGSLLPGVPSSASWSDAVQLCLDRPIPLVAAIGIGVLLAAVATWLGARQATGARQAPGAGAPGGRRPEGPGLGWWAGTGGRDAARRGFAQIAVAQFALAAVLLMSAGLLLRSYVRLSDAPLGAQTAGILSFWVTPTDASWSTRVGAARAADLLAGLEAIPQVEAASVARCTPGMPTCSRSPVFAVGGAARADDDELLAGRHDVGPDHFRLLGVPLLAGRAFAPHDRPGAPPVAIVSRAAAQRLWPGRSPREVIGRRITIGDPPVGAAADSTLEVVGVVHDVTYWPVDRPAGADVYVPALQRAWAETMVLVRPREPAAAASPAFLAAVRAALREIDPELPLVDVAVLDERLARALDGRRLVLVGLGVLSVLALLLASVGTYGIVAFGVARRRRELGVRLALGATPGGVFSLVLAEGARYALLGAAAGAGLAMLTHRLLRGVLYGVAPADPTTALATLLVLVAVALLASVLPARAAARLHPVHTLKAE